MSKQPANEPPALTPVTRLVRRSDKPPVLQVQRASLIVVDGPDKGAEQQIEQGGFVVGTSSACDLILTDPAVSRQHLEVLLDEERGFMLRDLGSKNGTTIGSLFVDRVYLTGGEEIRIGRKTRLQFVLHDDFEEHPVSADHSFGPLLGRSSSMRRVFAILERASRSDTLILLEGESGTGKDLAAEAIHQGSSRCGGPFVVVDCGAIQDNLLESELFGHKKGAFTGAGSDRAGAFESGNGGTVFLDEIGELSLATQPKLLRVLEKKAVRRLGENRYRPVDARLIAATNRDLAAEVKAGRFRQDLFFRLSVLRVRMPPLREHRDDIALLARGFAQKLRPDLDPVEAISDQALRLLVNHDWPGNVRELRNVVERILLFPENPAMALDDLPRAGTPGMPGYLTELTLHDARQHWVDHFERIYLSTLLDSCAGVVVRAAERAGVTRQTFHRLMIKHELARK